jgi:Rhamnan synthesis protein F
VPYRRILTGRDVHVVDTAAQVMSALSSAQVRELLLPPATVAAFTPAATREVASTRERAEEFEELEARAKEAEAKREQAEAAAALASAQARHAQAERNALLTSTTWQMTSPIRAAASLLPPRARRVLRGTLKLARWPLTLKLPRKFRELPISQTKPTLPAYTPAMVRPEQGAVQYRIDRNAGLSADDDVLVYVAYCSGGRLTALQIRSVEAYHAEGYRVVLVINSGMYSRMVSPGQTPAAIQIVRENVGLDFGAWAHAVRLIGGLESARSVTFANDSVVGPLPGTLPQGLRGCIEAIDADAVFMTKCLEICEHMQSYFFTFKAQALAKGGLQVLQNAGRATDKKQAIQNEEVHLSSRLEALGVSTREAFPCPDADLRIQNPTIHHWRTLVKAGFPFVKVSLVSAGILSIDSVELEEVLGTDLLKLLRLHLSQRKQVPKTRLADGNVPAQPALAIKARLTPSRVLQAYNLPMAQALPLALPLDDLGGARSEKAHTPSVLAIIHCFYLDEAENIVRELAALPLNFRVVLTTDTEAKAAALRSLLCYTALNGEVIVCPNRGRDVAPFIIEAQRRLRDETILLHLHTKKSPHYPNYNDWGRVVRRNLVGSPDIAQSILRLLANEGVGIVYSEHFREVAPFRNWGNNFLIHPH